MMRRLIFAASILVASFVSSLAADQAIVVTSCGSLPNQYAAGAPNSLVMDINGNLCGMVTGTTDVATYSSAVTGLANTAAGDLYCIIGSATKTIKVKGIRVSAVATASIVGDVSIVLRSTLSSGGGLASVPVVKMDQQNPASTATVNSFTSAPTPGTAIGTIRSRKIAASTQGNAATTSEGLFQFSVYWDQPIVLRGAAQAACVSSSAFGAGASWDIDHEHTEQ